MGFKIAYGAGHYKGTAGKRLPKSLDPNETREWVLNDRVAYHFARAALEYDGVEVMRVDDATGETEVSLSARCSNANKWGADFCLAIHHNAGINGGSGGGIEAFSYPNSTKGAEYRDAIYEACIEAGGLKGNRSKPKQAKAFFVLSNTKAPAVLMEYGFMDSKTDAPVILTDEYSKLVAYATMEGIAKIAGLKRKEAQTEQKPTTTAKKSNAEVAKEVIAGKWGNGADRKQKLTAAGYDYDAVQAEVNAQLTGKQTVTPVKSVDEVAREVIAGKWGNGTDRKNKLAAAGHDYDAVQKRVNELLK